MSPTYLSAKSGIVMRSKCCPAFHFSPERRPPFAPLALRTLLLMMINSTTSGSMIRIVRVPWGAQEPEPYGARVKSASHLAILTLVEMADWKARWKRLKTFRWQNAMRRKIWPSV